MLFVVFLPLLRGHVTNRSEHHPRHRRGNACGQHAAGGFPLYVGAGLSRPEGRALTAAQLAVIAGVIAQQVVASALTLERAPMFSWYDMYSGTYASPAAFNASRPPSFRIVATTDRGRAELRCDPHEEFVREYQAALAGSPTAKASVWRALRGCLKDLAPVRDVTLEGNRQVFDWDRLVFTTTRAAVILGPLPAS